MPNPLFSVNIVTRNRKDELLRAIDSVYDQAYRPFEVVVVDNASEDGSAETVLSRHPDVRLIRLHRNIGCQPARNIGMSNCRGKYIFNLDDDGWLSDDALATIVQRFEREPDLFLVNARVIIPEADRQGWRKPVSGDRERYIANFSGCACALRAEMLTQTGYFPEYPRGHAEADLSLRALDRGKKLLYLPSARVFHQPSAEGRDFAAIRYWLTRHRLETALRLSPFPYLLAEIPWKMAVELKVAWREKSLGGVLRGLGAFAWSLPRLLAQRKPVSRKTIRLRDYLTYTVVADPEELKSDLVMRFSLPKMICRKFRRAPG